MGLGVQNTLVPNFERLGTEVRPHILLRKVLLPPLEGDGDVAEAEGGDYGRKALTG